MKKLILAMSLVASGGALAGGSCVNTNIDGVWSTYQNTDGNINVTDASAMAGTDCGLEIGVSSVNKNYVADLSPTNELRYRQAMCVDPNSIPMPTSGTFRKLKFHNIQCTSGACTYAGILQFKLQNTNSGYEITGFVTDANSNNDTNKFSFPLADAPNRVEYDLDFNAGTFKLWVDATSEGDTPVVDITGIDLLSIMGGGVSEMRLGQVNKPTSLTPGDSFYVDEPESRRQTFIGGTCL